jgi:hypothetical protein
MTASFLIGHERNGRKPQSKDAGQERKAFNPRIEIGLVNRGRQTLRHGCIRSFEKFTSKIAGRKKS